ncbi:ATP-dependent Clp protease proteolytic subunit [Hymenobacter cavernae]|uniref:ATP-dependent Clp protease proteolytic subunit n=1 Tax=Hymenobacter cavernae TaxID=2044852 RepID=A0ABQ1ULY4_9BACT|nr:ATP-dependent Clp protease proteolytic subunit [Hymenobacter cavernae]GGF22320.1 hypothetical protein GCM10011383_37440 [Hymenobacter cavernae]
MERELLIFEGIEMWHAANLDTFLSNLERSGARSCTIRLNSPGGSWLAGQTMRARILASKLTVTTVNEGLVGSACTLVFAAGNVRQAQAHAKFMMHQISGQVDGQIKEIKKVLAAQEALNRSTAEMYVAVSTKSVEEWEQMMEAETWLSAQEAKAIAFCTEVLPAKVGLVAPDASMSGTELHKFYMSLIPKQTEEMKLEEVRNALGKAGVKLADNATEADVLAAIEKLQNKASEPVAAPKSEETELERLKRELQELKDSRANDTANQIEQLVNSAISSGKITATQKDTYTSLLKADFTNTSKILGDMPGRTSVAQRTNLIASTTGADSRNDWDFDKWSKEDERGLLDMKRNNPDKYQNLVAGIK